jgi:excisionase family DNA binding protein
VFGVFGRIRDKHENGVSVTVERLLTAEDVASMLGVPKAWVYAASRRGELPTVRLGRYRRYRREAVEAWIEQQEQDQRRVAR